VRSWLLGIDVPVVVLFVLLGRQTHDEGNALSDVVVTSAPFLLALIVAWGVTRAWRAPTDVRRGVVVAAVTLVGGMVLRRVVFSEGTAVTFVVVAAGFLTLGLLGWRAIAGGRRSMAALARRG
jgi:hypothetical protein